MKSFTNVHVIFNFAIGKKINLVTRYILNGQREVSLLSFHPQFHTWENWMTFVPQSKFVFLSSFLFTPSLQVVVLWLQASITFYEYNRDY